MHGKRTSFLALALLVSCSSQPGSAPQPTARPCVIGLQAPRDWRLHADGTTFRDQLGRVVFLRGVDGGGRSKFAPFMPFDYGAPGATFEQALDAYMDRAASWGIDVMRVPFAWEALEPAKGQYDQDWLSRYERVLDAAWARGIWTIVDFHQDVYAQNFCGDGFPTWTLSGSPPPPHHDCGTGWVLEYAHDAQVQAAFDRFWADGSSVQAAYVAAWDLMTARSKDRPGVLGFEPVNEPGWGTQAPATFEATTLAAFYARMATRIRAAAPGSLVFVDPVSFDAVSATTTLVNPGVEGVVFAPHYYPLGLPSPDEVLAGLGRWAAIGKAWNVPVFIGEFGVSHDDRGALDDMAAHFAALDRLGLSGAEWQYTIESENWNSVTNSVVDPSGREYPVAGALIRPFARAVGGEVIAQSWDPSSASYSLSFTPTAGRVTEVQVPPRAFPAGMSVHLTGACYDVTSASGRMLVAPDPGAAEVDLRIASHAKDSFTRVK